MRSVLITGGGTGIGAAAAHFLAAKGHDVTICGRRAELLETVVRDAAAAGHTIKSVAMDVGREEDVVGLFNRNQYDAIVCSAGIIDTGTVFELDTARFKAVLDANLMGTYFVCREAMRQMRARGVQGDIVNISSISGIRGMQMIFPGSFSYVAAKHAVAGLSEALAVDGRPYGIRVNCLSPGRVDTAMSRQFGGIPEIKPEQVAALIAAILDRTYTGVLSGSNIEIYSHD
jgi:NAD(P)-dependent dehydrogenase (short-subunit alcohol dehydrogenase family)